MVSGTSVTGIGLLSSWTPARPTSSGLAACRVPATFRLPIEDHNTRIVVFGADTEQARAATAEIAKNAFHNVSFVAGTLDDLVAGLGEQMVVAQAR